MIPNKLVIDDNLAYKTSLGNKIQSLQNSVLKDPRNPNFNALFALAFYILQHSKAKDSKSTMQPYFDSLPWSSVYNFPIMFNI